MLETLAFILIVLPFLAAAGCFIIRVPAVRNLIVLATCAVVAAGSIILISHAPFTMAPDTLFGIGLAPIVQVADFVLLAIVLFYGVKHRSALIIALAVAQIALLGYFEFAVLDHAKSYPTIVVDNLALVMVLIISIVGSAICVFALPYMKEHEEHLHLTTSKLPRFFLVLIMFLGAMNGLVMANDLIYFYFFFEVTTLCSFLLIGHDGTEIAIKNAVRALWMNSLGGIALLVALVWLYDAMGTLEIAAIVRNSPKTTYVLLPLAFLCFAGFTKAAQMPFQSWLLGAMVAPTPVSALLHSSTMVKAGVYLVVRFAPSFAETSLSTGVALVGGFTFLATAALAVGQSNGKKILAYSTISNLGLILACAGINTPAAITAAILLIVFHAVSKALLFLCVGTIEQRISSRDIEDMRGVYAKLPMTALITVIGVLTMILPPFGMLLGKWMAIQSASGNIFLIVMLALGSALTVVYWARWAGTLMNTTNMGVAKLEKQALLIRAPLVLLCVGAVILSFAAPWLYTSAVVPALEAYKATPFTISAGSLDTSVGTFVVYPLFIVAAVGFIFAAMSLSKAQNAPATQPYMCGIQATERGTYIGPMNQTVQAVSGNYYLSAVFGEETLTRKANIGAGLLLILMIVMGGAL